MASIQEKVVEKGSVSSNGAANKLKDSDQAIHGWYRFVLSFPPHLVRAYLNEFKLGREDRVLDPFSGTGTTLVESKLNCIPSIGIEANPFAHFSGKVKLSWDHDVSRMRTTVDEIMDAANETLAQQGIRDGSDTEESEIDELQLLRLDEKRNKLLIKNSISPLPLHKTLVLKSKIDAYKSESFYEHYLLSLARSTVYSVSNLRFGPEVGTGRVKNDAPVIQPWADEVKTMIDDLEEITGNTYPVSLNVLGDSRGIHKILDPNSIDAVITSPPYPNEKDYSRTTRLESVLLDLMDNPKELRRQKKTFIRSNTRGVYKDDGDYEWIKEISEITELAERIENRRIELGKTSGFEKRYAKVTLEYFGGMARHLSQLRYCLRPGARLAYVVGDQASYLRVMIRTGKLLGQIAESLGYSLERIDLFRTRFATVTKEELREEVLILKWDGSI